MAGVDLNDYRNDEGEWLCSPEQIRADMAWEPDPYDDEYFYEYMGDPCDTEDCNSPAIPMETLCDECAYDAEVCV